MLPFLLMILHFSQIGFTEDLTFISFLSFRKKSIYYITTKSLILQVEFSFFLNFFLFFLFSAHFYGFKAKNRLKIKGADAMPTPKFVLLFS